MIIHLIVGLIKKRLYRMSQYFPKPYEHSGEDINVKVGLSSSTAKTDFKKATGANTSKLATKFDLASLKAQIDNKNVDKLKTVPVDFSQQEAM